MNIHIPLGHIYDHCIHWNGCVGWFFPFSSLPKGVLMYDPSKDLFAAFMPPKEKAKLSAKMEKLRNESDRTAGVMLMGKSPVENTVEAIASGTLGKLKKRSKGNKAHNKQIKRMHEMCLIASRKSGDSIRARFSPQS